VFKLSFCVSRLGREGILLPFLFVLIIRHPVFIARAMCGLLNVNVAALYSCSAAVTGAVSSVVAGSAVCLLVPTCAYNPES
jgi:hypothetical protein